MKMDHRADKNSAKEKLQYNPSLNITIKHKVKNTKEYL